MADRQTQCIPVDQKHLHCGSTELQIHQRFCPTTTSGPGLPGPPGQSGSPSPLGPTLSPSPPCLPGLPGPPHSPGPPCPLGPHGPCAPPDLSNPLGSPHPPGPTGPPRPPDLPGPPHSPGLLGVQAGRRCLGAAGWILAQQMLDLVLLSVFVQESDEKCSHLSEPTNRLQSETDRTQHTVLVVNASM